MKNKKILEMIKKTIATGVLTTMAFVATPDKMAHAIPKLKLTTSTIGKDAIFNEEINEYLEYSQYARECIETELANPTPEIQNLIEEHNITMDELKAAMFDSAMKAFKEQKEREREQKLELEKEEHDY